MKLRKEAYRENELKEQERRDKEKHGKDEVNVDQKYKDDILSGRTMDNTAGYNYSTHVYDKEMLHKDFVRRNIRRIPFVIIGIGLLVYLVFIVYKNIDLRFNATAVRIPYISQDEDLQHKDKDAVGGVSYDGYALIVEDNLGDDKEMPSHSIKNLININQYAFLRVIVDANKYSEAYKQYDEETGYRNVINELDAYKVTILVQKKISNTYRYKNGEYVDLYYKPQNGENIMDLKLADAYWYIALVVAVGGIFNVILWWRIVKDVLEKRREDRSFNSDN